jgi:hypothetical protein
VLLRAAASQPLANVGNDFVDQTNTLIQRQISKIGVHGKSILLPAIRPKGT